MRSWLKGSKRLILLLPDYPIGVGIGGLLNDANVSAAPDQCGICRMTLIYIVDVGIC